MNKASAEAAAGAGAEAPRPRRGSLKGSRGSGPQGAGVSVSNAVSVANVPMNYFNRLARLPYNNQRNAAYQAAASRRLAEKEAAANAKAKADAEAEARAKAEAEAKARAQAQAKPQNAYQQGVQQGYHEVECKEGEKCSVQGGTRRQRKIKHRSKAKASRRNAWKRKCKGQGS